jgi:hypothetical protein
MAPPSLDLDRALRSAAQALRVPPFEVNPFASLGFLRDGTAFDFSIVAPIPGEGLRRTMVRRGHADLHTFLFRLMLPGRGETPPDVVRHELVRCGVLVPPDAVPREVPFDRPGESIVNAPAVSPATLASARGQLAGRGFAELQSLLHPAWLASLRAYYEAQFREGFFEAVDAHRRRFAAHDEKVAADLHRQLLPLIAAAMPGRLAPGHCDVSLDREGAVIEKPAGREGSEYVDGTRRRVAALPPAPQRRHGPVAAGAGRWPVVPEPRIAALPRGAACGGRLVVGCLPLHARRASDGCESRIGP